MSRFVRLRRLLAASFAVGSALAAACVPNYEFRGADAEPPGDASDVTIQPDAARDATASPDAGSDAGNDPSDANEAGALIARSTLTLGKGGYGGAICATKAGKVYCWGDLGANRYGELGFPLDDDAGAFVRPRLSPTRAFPDQLEIGEDHSCYVYAADASAGVTCRGRNEGHQIGNPGAPSASPTEFDVTNLPAGGMNAIAATVWATCGITTKDTVSGNVWCWGFLGDGALGRPLNDTHDYDKAWGVIRDSDGGTPGIHDAVTVAGGAYHACVITAPRKILCWGASGVYQSGPNAGGTGCTYVDKCSGTPQEVVISGQEATQLALGELHSCALVKSGKVFCWGGNGNNQLGSGGAVLPKTCVDHGSSMGCTDVPTEVPGLTNVVAISAGLAHTCALHVDRHISCWGTNDDGELGTGDRNAHTTPVVVKDINTSQSMLFDEVVAGGWRTCGRVGTDVYCWGAGELGTTALDGAVADRNWPAPVVW